MTNPWPGSWTSRRCRTSDGTGSVWFTYLAVDDLDAALREAEAAGGVVQRQPFSIPLAGRIAIVTDPGGAAVLIMPETLVD